MVDARGFICPMPVVMVQNEVKANAPATLEVLVDDRCAVENVTRVWSFRSEKLYRNISHASRGTDDQQNADRPRTAGKDDACSA